jgi:P-type Ca2+ transporter type 2B
VKDLNTFKIIRSQLKVLARSRP